MSGGIEDMAKSWLLDPAWQKVFKHTSDVLEDYVSYALVAVGAICLSVRLLTTLGTGDLVCIAIGVEVSGNKTINLGPYPSGGTVAMVNYAQREEPCIREVFTIYMEYLPYIMLLQTLLLVVTEKFTFRLPRIAQRVERFYKNIVEESLFGKDPDVAEDMYDATTSTEAISRRRQRNEICVMLKQSSFIHTIYIGKNFAEILLVLLYLPINIFYACLEVDQSKPCSINVQAFPGIIDEPGVIHLQCRGKKMTFFRLALWVHVVLLLLHGVCSLVAIVWCKFYRPVTTLLRKIEELRKEGSITKLKNVNGEDFLFLFDLLAHSCGLESTLRVLTHSDETFYEICKPNIDEVPDHLQLEEDKLKVTWRPSDIERWLQTGKKIGRSQRRPLIIDSYEVTIFPAESVNHAYTKPAKLTLAGLNKDGTMTNRKQIDPETALVPDKEDEEPYSHWFLDLNGGRTEYVVTIATMIGKSRMKGEKVVTNLVPYGPEKPRSGMVKTAGTDQVEIFWDPPKGDFTKYTLTIDRLSDDNVVKPDSLLRLGSTVSKETELDNEGDEDENKEIVVSRPNVRLLDNLSSKLTTYTILGLDPGEKYRIELGTKTGRVATRQTIDDIILTRPLPPRGVRVSDVTSATCTVYWLHPEGHPCLRGFQIQVRSSDGKVFKDVAVTKNAKSFLVRGLQPCQDYDIAVTSLAVADSTRRTESEEALISTTTVLEKVKNLKFEHSTPNSIAVKWDSAKVIHNLKYKLSISGDTKDESEDRTDQDQEDDTVDTTTTKIVNIKEYSSSYDVPGDKTQFNFTKLPDIVGTGHVYNVTITAAAVTHRENEVASPEVVERFMTKPLTPTNFRLGSKEKSLQIIWHKSMTPNVTAYRVRWRPMVEAMDGETKTEEATVNVVTDDANNNVTFEFPPDRVKEETGYKVNVYAVAEACGMNSESKELHEKIWVKNTEELEFFDETKDKPKTPV